jgi:hypothetical protein
MNKKEKSDLGKKSRRLGKAFELRVRHDLESKGWIVDRWSNNVELFKENSEDVAGIISDGKAIYGKLISAKHTFNPFTKAMSAGNGFPDFMAFKESDKGYIAGYDAIFNFKLIECKTNGKLDKIEKEKIEWIKNALKIPCFVASKGTKRGEIIYTEKC